MINKFYVYVHRRLSDNKPFYVGKGKDKRAFSKHNRNKFWNNVVDKHGYKVEIVFDTLTEEGAFQCEKDTILEFRYFEYPLVNLTTGGDGASGFKQSDKTKQLKSEIGLARKDEFKAYAKEQWLNYSQEQREERLRHLDSVRNNTKALEKISLTSKERWADAEYKEKLSNTQKISQKLVADVHSSNMKAKWADPKYKAKMLEARKNARLRKLAEASLINNDE